MKTILKLIVVAVVLTAVVQGSRAALTHYQFKDEISQAMLFTGQMTQAQLAERVEALAIEYDIPIEPAAIAVKHESYAIKVTAPYTRVIALVPGLYSRAWDFDASVSVRQLQDTRPTAER